MTESEARMVLGITEKTSVEEMLEVSLFAVLFIYFGIPTSLVATCIVGAIFFNHNTQNSFFLLLVCSAYFCFLVTFY
jgi:hypothetical protein